MRTYAHRIASATFLTTFLMACLTVIGPPSVLGQEIERQLHELRAADRGAKSSSNGIIPLHVTDRLIASPEGQAALASYRERKEQGLLPVAKGTDAGTPFVTEKTFTVRNFRTGIHEPIDFTLTTEETRFNTWVETSQLASSPDGDITTEDIERMRKALADSTGPASYRPDLGIIALDELVFGDPPNIDGDSKTDVLIHDIRDNFDPENGQFTAILGFFDPTDLNSPNAADIIHIDIMPGMYTPGGQRRPFEDVQATLAHEYEHLIFQQEGGQAPTFVDEGLAEWAIALNGYVPRSISYPSSPSELRRPLLGFRSTSDTGVSFDYQRAGLFTNYVAERTSVMETGTITGTSSSVAQGYYRVLLGGDDPAEAFRQLVQDFHIANAINDHAAVPEYGHERDAYRFVQASGYPVFDGSESSGTSGQVSVDPGGVAYIAATGVSNVIANVNASSGSASDRARIRATVIAERSDGSVQTHDMVPAAEGVFLRADHDRIIIALMNDEFDSSSSPVSISYNATWDPEQNAAEFAEVVYDDGTLTTYETQDGIGLEGFSFFGPVSGPQGTDDRASNRFTIPPGAVLASVDVAVAYRNNFSNQNPSSEARDFRVGIWSSAQDGAPGEEIVSMDVVDGSNTAVGDDYEFQRVDLTAFRSQLMSLEGELHVSVENAGTDDNYIFMPHTNFDDEPNPSFLQTTFSDGETEWASYDDINSGGQFFWVNLVNTIRARFELGVVTDVEDELTVPQAVTLEQNYPNPFNPTTTIRFSLPESRQVHLRVFDMLGRQIATLADGTLPAGQHEVDFEAGSLSSGLYIYRLDTDGTSQTRTMMLVR